jgi:hypothetical protein
MGNADKVNERLREEELDAVTFNVDRPKGVFPSPKVCEDCLDDREVCYGLGPRFGVGISVYSYSSVYE